MQVETKTLFARVIQDHLDLKARNSELDGEMPLNRYTNEDPFENHPLFKSEEQAQLEETMEGVPAPVELRSTTLPWPGEETTENVGGPALDASLWGRSREFDWGD